MAVLFIREIFFCDVSMFNTILKYMIFYSKEMFSLIKTGDGQEDKTPKYCLPIYLYEISGLFRVSFSNYFMYN